MDIAILIARIIVVICCVVGFGLIAYENGHTVGWRKGCKEGLEVGYKEGFGDGLAHAPQVIRWGTLHDIEEEADE